MSRREEGLVILNLQLEDNAEISVEDFVIQSDTTGLVRAGEDVAGYTMVGQCQQYATTKGLKPGTVVCTSAVQGVITATNDPKNPVKFPRPVKSMIYVTGPQMVGANSVNKVPAGRALQMQGSEVLFICQTTGQV